MGQRWSTPSWPDEIFVVDCPRQKLFENIFMPSSVNDWLDTGELQAVEAVRDNDVAPGLLLKLKTEDATAYIEWTRREYDVGGIGEKIRWNFYWIGRPPPPEDVSVPSSKNTHTWVKKEATVKYTAQFTLSDPPNAPGTAAVTRARCPRACGEVTSAIRRARSSPLAPQGAPRSYEKHSITRTARRCAFPSGRRIATSSSPITAGSRRRRRPCGRMARPRRRSP